jgi:hypothetical protein
MFGCLALAASAATTRGTWTPDRSGSGKASQTIDMVHRGTAAWPVVELELMTIFEQEWRVTATKGGYVLPSSVAL